VKFRELLTKLNDAVRPVRVQGERHAGEPDALNSAPLWEVQDAKTAAIAPPGHVPSQQEEGH